MVSLSHKPMWGAPMLCQDTNGMIEAVHIPEETIRLARDLQPIIDAIRAHDRGEGEITLKIQRNKIPFIDWTVRTFRKIIDL